ncbi:GDP-L-fucose synthase family protein [Candidatus Pseudothioglobus sp. Uisw_050_01]|uniref:GDP-L-fucose synthase family protein n=1 Tax=Candidatus Pseudothioglobus sp. Uisw_050_01 TaxID=3230997 RepID=UPI003A86B91D
MKSKVYIAGHNGMVGSSIFRQLKNEPVNIITRAHSELDLTDQAQVLEFFKKEMPSEVYIAAGKVGGIYANSSFPADFIYENIMIQTNIIHAAFESGVKKLLFIGSSSIYPKLSDQPMKEDYLMTGSLEPSNEAYSIAKIAGIKMCESYNKQYGKEYGLSFRSIMPTNLYGIGDNYHSKNSHVIPSLIKRVHEAKIKNETLTVWGSGDAKREFLFVDDLASASIFIMKIENSVYEKVVDLNCSHLNAGYGEDISIKNLVSCITSVVGYTGEVKYDSSLPEGMNRKLLDSQKLNKLGWMPKINLIDGLELTYKDYLKKIDL